jgi:hypothetical protein
MHIKTIGNGKKREIKIKKIPKKYNTKNFAQKC